MVTKTANKSRADISPLQMGYSQQDKPPKQIESGGIRTEMLFRTVTVGQRVVKAKSQQVREGRSPTEPIVSGIEVIEVFYGEKYDGPEIEQ